MIFDKYIFSILVIPLLVKFRLHAISALELRYFEQETIGQLHRKACEIFDLPPDQVKSSCFLLDILIFLKASLVFFYI